MGIEDIAKYIQGRMSTNGVKDASSVEETETKDTAPTEVVTQEKTNVQTTYAGFSSQEECDAHLRYILSEIQSSDEFAILERYKCTYVFFNTLCIMVDIDNGQPSNISRARLITKTTPKERKYVDLALQVAVRLRLVTETCIKGKMYYRLVQSFMTQEMHYHLVANTTLLGDIRKVKEEIHKRGRGIFKHVVEKTTNRQLRRIIETPSPTIQQTSEDIFNATQDYVQKRPVIRGVEDVAKPKKETTDESDPPIVF